MDDFKVTVKTKSGEKSISINPVDIEYTKSSMLETYLYMIDGTVHHVMEEEIQLGKRIGYYLKGRG